MPGSHSYDLAVVGAGICGPMNADALAGSAYAYFREFFFGWGNADTAYEAKVLGQADRATALDPNNVRADWSPTS